MSYNSLATCNLSELNQLTHRDGIERMQKKIPTLELFIDAVKDSLKVDQKLNILRRRPEYAQVETKEYKALLEDINMETQEKTRQIMELSIVLERMIDTANTDKRNARLKMVGLPVGILTASLFINRALRNSNSLSALKNLVEIFSNHKPSISEKRENRKKVGKVTATALLASTVSVAVQGYEIYQLQKLNDYLLESVLIVESLMNGLPTDDETISHFYETYSEVEEYRDLIDVDRDKYRVSIYILDSAQSKLNGLKKTIATHKYELDRCEIN